MSDPLHNPAFPDCPIWMRITDMPKKTNTNTFATPQGQKPSNMTIPWYLYDADLVSMLDQGLSGAQIAEQLNLPKNAVVQKIHRLVQSGEYVPKPEE